jgi:hypothetical protein
VLEARKPEASMLVDTTAEAAIMSFLITGLMLTGLDAITTPQKATEIHTQAKWEFIACKFERSFKDFRIRKHGKSTTGFWIRRTFS